MHFSKLILKWRNKKSIEIIDKSLKKQQVKENRNLLLKILINTLIKLFQTWQNILAHHLQVLMITLTNMALLTHKKSYLQMGLTMQTFFLKMNISTGFKVQSK